MAAPLVKTKTPGIYKRGSRYVFSYRVDGKQRWESCRTLEEASRAKRRATPTSARRVRGTVPGHAPRIRDEWVDRYQGRAAAGSVRHRDDYRRMLDQYVFRYFPARPS